MTTTFIYIGSFIALLGVLVAIHEYGHFIFARIFNVHVQRFSLGMGPVIYKKNDKHGTEFALSAVPLGGYVSMISEKMFLAEPETKSEFTEDQLKNTFESKPKWQRASIMFAGPLANLLLAIFQVRKYSSHLFLQLLYLAEVQYRNYRLSVNMDMQFCPELDQF